MDAGFTAHTIRAKSKASGAVAVLSDILFGDVWVCSGQSNMAFSAPIPLRDPAAEGKIVAAYSSDPGATIDGVYLNATEGIAAAADYPQVRLMVVGNVHNCTEPLDDFFPSGRAADSTHPLHQNWTRATPAIIGAGADVMGGTKGGFSATCWYFGMELQKKLQVPIGLVHSSYGGSAVEDWISSDTLGDGTLVSLFRWTPVWAREDVRWRSTRVAYHSTRALPSYLSGGCKP
jgi:sialate O-acetylesterase